MAPAGSMHGDAAMRLGWRLAHHVETNSLGVVFAAETGFKLSSNPDTVRAPDVAFIARERAERIGIPEGDWPGAPDLAVEVVSPSVKTLFQGGAFPLGICSLDEGFGSGRWDHTGSNQTLWAFFGSRLKSSTNWLRVTSEIRRRRTRCSLRLPACARYQSRTSSG
jgi:hypothetical protein